MRVHAVAAHSFSRGSDAVTFFCCILEPVLVPGQAWSPYLALARPPAGVPIWKH